MKKIDIKILKQAYEQRESWTGLKKARSRYYPAKVLYVEKVGFNKGNNNNATRTFGSGVVYVRYQHADEGQ